MGVKHMGVEYEQKFKINASTLVRYTNINTSIWDFVKIKIKFIG